MAAAPPDLGSSLRLPSGLSVWARVCRVDSF